VVVVELLVPELALVGLVAAVVDEVAGIQNCFAGFEEEVLDLGLSRLHMLLGQMQTQGLL
jgi:hypothetical protein